MLEALGRREELIFKIGYSTSLDRRLLEVNAFMPCDEALCWQEVKTQAHEDEINAWAMEQRIFDLLEARGIECVKGEIFCATPEVVERTWAEALLTTERPTKPIVVPI